LRINAKNHSEACQNLNIENEEYPQIPEMRPKAILKEWQPVAVDRLNQIRQNGLTRGAILADAVGLGKSWEALALMMHIARTESHQGKAFIVVVPYRFLGQWIAKIRAFTDFFRIHIYGSKRQVENESWTDCVEEELTKQHKIFRGEECNRAELLVTSYTTLSAKHSPSAVKAWCENNGRVYNQDAPDMPADCEWSLQGKFAMAIFDEAHVLREPGSDFSLVSQWLQASFNLLLTATPFFCGIRDFESYALILLRSCPSVANAYDPTRMTGIVHSVVGSDDAEILCSREFVSKHVMAPGIGTRQCETRLRAILKHLMVRRTVASCAWLDSDQKISACHPAALRVPIITPFQDAELQIYQSCAKKYQYNFLDPVPGHSQRYKWDMQKLRPVLMGSTWIGLMALERRLASPRLISDIDALNDGRSEGRSFYQKRMPAATEPDVGRSDRNRDPLRIKSEGLDLLLRGSPKLSSLLQSLKHQVCLLREKAAIWTYHPGEEVFVGAALYETGIPFAILHPDSHKWRRESIIKNLTATSGNGCMVLVLSYLVPSLDLDLHLVCRQVYLFSPPPSRAVFDQAIGRVFAFRCGQTRRVTIFEHRVPDTLNINLDKHSRWSDLPGFETDIWKTLAPKFEEDSFAVGRYVIRRDQIVTLAPGERPVKDDIKDPRQIVAKLERLIWGRR
ncbi:hypothetical protein BP00DRAFT_342443, partial [Aspergillus indologenus CBS 114.80]